MRLHDDQKDYFNPRSLPLKFALSLTPLCAQWATVLCTDVNNTHPQKLGNYFGCSLTANNHITMRSPQLRARPWGVGEGPAKGRAPQCPRAPERAGGAACEGTGDMNSPSQPQAVSTANTANTCPTPPSPRFLQSASY